MNAPCKDIAAILSSDVDLDLTLKKDLFYTRVPPAPDDCVTVIDNPGEDPMLQYTQSRSNYYYPAVSVWVRAKDYQVGYSRISCVLALLHGLAHTTVNEAYYSLIKAKNDPQLLHFDENGRAVFIVNFAIQRRAVI